MSDNGTAAIAIVFLFGAPIGALVVTRILAHRERMEMIRRGMVPPARFGKGVGGPGMNAGSFVPQPPPVWTAPPENDPDCTLRKGITTSLIGFALLIGLSFIGFNNDGPLNTPAIHPGPWLLGGLIPMFVGIAQIIIALVSGARIGGPNFGPGPNRYGPPPSPSQPEVHVYEPEPRTHSGFEELKRPVPPPDRR